MKRNYWNRVMAICIVGCLLLGQNAYVVKAAQESTEKEEVVYAMLNNDGSVDGVYVVNSFAGGQIMDYGEYTNVKNLTSEDEISVQEDQITIVTDADKLYYQGDLNKRDIPWNITLHYALDDVAYSPEEIAGKSGKLKLGIQITQNEACDPCYWEGYALQVSLVLDCDTYKHIVANDATIANVGSKKQLSYIILPGKDADFTVTADVTDFTMEEISINGIQLNLAMEIDDSELLEKIQELQNSVSNVNKGAGTVDEGAVQLSDGIQTIQNALDSLNEKSVELTSGSSKMYKALTTLQSSLAAIQLEADDLATLSESSSSIKKGIGSVVNGLDTISESIDSYNSQLKEAGLSDTNVYLAQHEQAIAALAITDTQRNLYTAYVSGGNEAVATKLGELVQQGNNEASLLYQRYQLEDNAIQEYLTNAGKLISTEKLLKGDMNYIKGSSTLINGIAKSLDKEQGKLMCGAVSLQSGYVVFDQKIQLLVSSLNSLAENMTTLKKGIADLVSNYKTLDNGVNGYTDAVAKIVVGYTNISEGANNLAAGTAKLSAGTTEFYAQTKNMDTQISDSIQDTMNEITGKNVETTSFVSEKNTNVKSVLFVMKTPKIEQDKIVVEAKEEEEHTSGWQKFLKLFGL